MEWISNNWAVIIEWISYIVLIATAIVKITPNETDNKWLEKFVKIFEVIAGNTPPIKKKDA